MADDDGDREEVHRDALPVGPADLARDQLVDGGHALCEGEDCVQLEIEKGEYLVFQSKYLEVYHDLLKCDFFLLKLQRSASASAKVFEDTIVGLLNYRI